MMPKITFSICNCNRLNYFKSCVESLLICAGDYANKEILCVDNGSVEDGTQEYFDILKDRGFTTKLNKERDYSNEFAKFLNWTVENATGDFIVPLQGDMQFILQFGWLEQYIKFYKENLDKIGCIVLDAQRRITNSNHNFSEPSGVSTFKFVFDHNRPPIAGAADVMYSREVLQKIYPWHTSNIEHEGGQDSETHMLAKIRRLSMHDPFVKYLRPAVPIVPVSAMIYNSQGSNARVRKNKRYGEYLTPKQDFRYYEIMSFKEYKYISNKIPFGFEDMVKPIGFELMIDKDKNLIKNPIRPETATKNQFVELYPEEKEENIIKAEDEYLNEWENG